MNISIVDYGAGNIASVQNAVYMAGYEADVAHTPEDVLKADRIILPGVGAAGKALAHLRATGLAAALTETVRGKGRPMLGICLGMQLLATTLHEYGEHEGLGWIEGDVVDLHSIPGAGPHIPHTGWNVVTPTEHAAFMFQRIRRDATFYFNHSFTLRTPNDDVVAGITSHGVPLVAAIQTETVFAVQFHPEKSQLNGDHLISAFLSWAP
ncbi:imidazole glycerol phosphate synthase subunit HisH [Magnetovibrio sp.]|uniref:imidazole glycerol phosphate synthase subunit HisH n=1 Tax=Magnetovibrio sp. TaxID=2024836 RepID=UPI002F928C8B